MALVILVVAVTLIGVGGAFTLLSTFKESMSDAANSTALLRAHGDADMMHDAFRADYYAALLHGARNDHTKRAEVKNELADHKKNWLAANATIRATPKTPEIEKVFLAMEPRIAAYIDQTEKQVDFAFADAVAAREKMDAFDKMFEDLEKPMSALSDLIEKRNQETAAAAAERASSAGRIVSIVGFILIFGIVGASIWTTRNIGGQIKLITQATQELAAGDADLTRRIPAMTGELGGLGAAVNLFIARLHDIVAEVVAKSASIAIASSQISTGSTDLSSRTEQQASTLEETASSMEEFTTSIRQTAANTQAAAQSARHAIENAEAGRGIVVDAGERMNDIHVSAKRITEITNIIDSIAFQTNILALNAAVEAARAGEQGRGFAVVAGEVRALAQRSASSAKDIKHLIDDTAASIEAGTTLVRNAGAAMEKIVDSNQEVLHTVTEINTAAGEQSAGVEQVNKAIMQLEGVTQQNAALVEESAAAAESMRDQAGQLHELVSRFKLDGGLAQREIRETSTPARRAAPPHSTARGEAGDPRLPRRSGAISVAGNTALNASDWEEF